MEFSLSDISTALLRSFPESAPFGPLSILGSGFGSLAVETSRGWVFRIARTPRAGAQYAREVQVLPVLARYLPVAVPQPFAYLAGGPDFPYGVIGYPKLPGDPPELNDVQAQREAMAEQIGEIIFALQSIPVELLPWSDDFAARQEEWRRQRAMTLPALRRALHREEYSRVEAWWDELLSSTAMQNYTPALQHGDLWYGNLLVEGRRVVGLIDFENVAVGDPALDFSTQLYPGERFLRRVMAAFLAAGGNLDSGVDHRLAAWWGLREFGGVVYSLENHDRQEFAESIEKIRRGPILSSRGLDGWGPDFMYPLEAGGWSRG